MIAHIVVFTWREGEEPDADEIASHLMSMAAGIPAIRFYRAGANLRLRPNGGDFGVIAVVDDAAGLDSYLDAPAHIEAVAGSITPHLGTRQAVQLEISGPDLPEGWL